MTNMPMIKMGSTIFQQVARHRPQGPSPFHFNKSRTDDCFFTYWSLLGAVAGWSMTASSVIKTSNTSSTSPSLSMTQDVAAYSTLWTLGSLWVNQSPLLMACHLSNVGAVLYHYLVVHADRADIKSFRAADWQCHGEQIMQPAPSTKRFPVSLEY